MTGKQARQVEQTIANTFVFTCLAIIAFLITLIFFVLHLLGQQFEPITFTYPSIFAMSAFILYLVVVKVWRVIKKFG